MSNGPQDETPNMPKKDVLKSLAEVDGIFHLLGNTLEGFIWRSISPLAIVELDLPQNIYTSQGNNFQLDKVV